MGKNIYDFGYDLAELFEFVRKNLPRGIIPWRVSLPGVSYPGKSLMTPGSLPSLNPHPHGRFLPVWESDLIAGHFCRNGEGAVSDKLLQ